MTARGPTVESGSFCAPEVSGPGAAADADAAQIAAQ
jgi:hypothetical protein